MRSADARIGGKDIGAPEAPSTEPPTSTVASKSDAQKLAFSCARSGADCYGPCARHAEIVFAGELCLNAEMRAAFATEFNGIFAVHSRVGRRFGRDIGRGSDLKIS
jgi:hypothetical protein